MQFRTLRHWKNPGQLAGLVYFAQLLDELLFDFTSDTYKPSAMNTSTLCLEARTLVHHVEADQIDAKNLDNVFEELVASLRADEIAKALYPINPDTLERELNSSALSLQSKAAQLDVLLHRINLFAYKSKAEELIAASVCDSKEKDRIRKLTRTYVTMLISIGYSTRYLRDITISYFHRNANIFKLQDIQGFFDKVDGKDREYRAIFRVGEIFSQIDKSCEAFDLTICKDVEPSLRNVARQMNFHLESFDRFAVSSVIKAKDVFAARAEATRELEMISALTNVFYHKEVPNWGERALMVNVKTGKARVVSAGTNPMMMCEDNRPKAASRRLNRLMDEFSLEKTQDFIKFFRIAELHAFALKSESPENQLLNLWVALESIVPASSTGGGAKIQGVIDSLIPVLNLDYVANLTVRLVRDFRNWNRTAFEAGIGGIPGDNDRERLLRLLMLDEHKKQRKALYQHIGNFELLRNRAAYFERALRSTGEIRRLLDGHGRRVSWQLRRIYRTRNLIVHTGTSPRYIDVLIKNLHDYLDILIGAIVYQASDGEKINSIDQAFAFARIKYREYKERLEGESETISVENIQELLLAIKIRA